MTSALYLALLVGVSAESRTLLEKARDWKAGPEMQKAAQEAMSMTQKGIDRTKDQAQQGLKLVVAEEKKAEKQVIDKLHKIATYKFADFVRDYGRNYQQGTDEWKKHEEIFQKNLNEILAHNSADQPWEAGINKFLDHSTEMKATRLGYNGRRQNTGGSSLLQTDYVDEELELPDEHSWSLRLAEANGFQRDQGSCGSCWAVAAVQALEDHIVLRHNETVRLSEQAMVSCTPNPKQCGGTGGCQGATAELAFDWVKEAGGIPALVNMPYTSSGGSDGKCDERAALSHVKIGGYVVLPENQGLPLLQALYQHGPVVISADASNWFMYSGGVFAGCAKDAVINHAIVAEGFGKQKVKGTDHAYFLVKNSWGQDWGEKGYIKLARADDHCGIDHKPEEGTGCLGGPTQTKVCGMCGMYYDSVYPTDGEFVTVEKGGTYVKGKEPAGPWRKSPKIWKENLMGKVQGAAAKAFKR